jgi:hypothetical protein
MALNWRDVGQAISDLQLQIIVILGTLILLICFTVIFGVISKRLNRSTARNVRPKAVVGLRLRMRHSAWQAGQSAPQTSSWWGDFWQGISTEFFGAVVTTIFLGLGVLIFDQYQDIQNRKADLILQMGSSENTITIEAVRQLRAEGWLQDGTLYNATLSVMVPLRQPCVYRCYAYEGLQPVGTNLQGVDLSLAYLQGTNLGYANLEGVNLYYANLEGANLGYANLEGANLYYANLEGHIS